jgi:hypothetical protein
MNEDPYSRINKVKKNDKRNKEEFILGNSFNSSPKENK